MKKTTIGYLTDNHAMSWPWFETPFYKTLLDNIQHKDWKEKCCKFAEDGYMIIDLKLDNDFIEGLKNDMTIQETEENKNYFYNPDPDHKRLFSFWRKSKFAQRLSTNPYILDTLRKLYGREALPFQTINFIQPSEQKAHSDIIHFHSQPQRWMAACWVALEPVNRSNGCLKVYPGSHRLPIYEMNDIGLRGANIDSGQDVDSDAQNLYQQYEEFINAMIQVLNLKHQYVILEPGQAIIWAANLLHGGSIAEERNRTRFSQVTHYYFEGCEEYYCPLFSNIHEGYYASKNLTDKNILGYQFNEDTEV